MVILRSVATAVAGVALLAQSSLAHSVKRNPVSYISLVEEPVIKTPSHRVGAFSKFDITFTLHNGQQKIRLALEPNHDVLHEDFAITHLNEDGSVREVKKVSRLEDKVYRGSAFIERQGIEGWSMAGWARVSVHHDGEHPLFDGAFRIDGDNHHILSRSEYQSMKDEKDPAVDASAAQDAMIVWRDSDVTEDDGDRTELKRDISETSTCNADTLDFNSNFRFEADESNLSLRSMNFGSLFGRQIDDGGGGTGLNLLNSIGSTAGCPTTKKVALVGIATDCNYFAAFNSTDAVKKQIIGIVNKASEIYESTFKVSLAIKNLTVIDRVCTGTTPANTPWNVKCSDDVTINDRLNTFSKWRGESKDENAYWTLFTTCATQTAVGLAWRGMLCRNSANSNGGGNSNNETVAATNVVVKADTEWQIFAHETGHTFGAVHDCVQQACPVSTSSQACCPLSKDQCDAGSKYIMNPSTGRGITSFSPCSIGNICSGLKSNMVKGGCLTDNKNVQTDVDIGSQCGNGIVESGEDCDCGGAAGCKDNKCCDPKTCKFTANSKCDPSNEDCCTAQCQFATSGTVCRPSTGECDVAESCPGDKASCPDDKHKNNGDSCGNGLQCAAGQCTSRDLQCQHMANSLSGRNNTKACPDTECLLACTSPDLPSNQCVTYNQYFVDGTNCGAGGHCSGGSCQGSSTAKEIGQWIENHKTIFIPIVVVVGSLILIAIISCISSSIRRRIRRSKMKKKPEMNSWPSSSNSGQTWGGPPPQQYQQYQQYQRQWNQQPQYADNNQPRPNDHGFYQQPPMYPPPPAANGDGRWGNQRSMRYA
ncbi:hypothetical protein QQS21_012329 [Conoideocrella luteorostrata]|uniref:Disintegrin and metalloproteinase domain-containing protein B n=1 Tax=Conoideocrella luteorostrata TaxID=1105319 RepID=A0AAJ0CE40_9HYPO|nr:hypothetical protein QQS21_012329 [Conoideocrella luteorostrata]